MLLNKGFRRFGETLLFFTSRDESFFQFAEAILRAIPALGPGSNFTRDSRAPHAATSLRSVANAARFARLRAANHRLRPQAFQHSRQRGRLFRRARLSI